MKKAEQIIRQLMTGQNELKAQFKLLKDLLRNDGPRSITEEIDEIEGRRIFYNLSGRQDFTIAQLAQRGDAVSFSVSQDGPFIMTHYPIVTWKPNLPAAADNHGKWSPVSSWPLPAQQNANQDTIDLSYEFFDGGAMRAFNNELAVPLFSRPDNLAPLPVPTLFAPNANIQFFPTFEDIDFSAGATVATTGGQLVVTLPGYRIVQL